MKRNLSLNEIHKSKQDVELVDELSEKIKQVKSEIAKVIIGQEDIIDQLINLTISTRALFAGWCSWFGKNSSYKNSFGSNGSEIQPHTVYTRFNAK